MLGDGLVVAFAIYRGEPLVFPVGRSARQQRPVLPCRSQGAFQVGGGGQVHGSVRLAE